MTKTITQPLTRYNLNYLLKMNYKNIKIPFYSGNIQFSNCLGQISLEQFLNSHQNPKPEILNLFDDIQDAARNNNLKLKNELKTKLFSFTPAVNIQPNTKRRLSSVKGFTGLMQLDFDKIDTKEMAIAIKNDIFTTNPSIICSYISPSGLGVKALLKTSVPTDLAHYKRLFNAVEREFECYSYFDTAPKNAVLPLYLSYDYNILVRPEQDVIDWTEEFEPEVHHQPIAIPKQDFTSRQQQYFYDKTVRIFTDKMNAIGTDGHPQLRSACLILGTRVGVGYISHSEAEIMAANLIRANGYLKKGIHGYIKTSQWGIRKGAETPREY